MVLDFVKKDGVATLKFNRPDKYNSFNQELAFAVQKALDDCKKDDDIRTIVLTGEGKAFCAGQDLAEATDPNGPPLKNIVGKHYNPIITQLRDIEKPVIAAVNGVAAGAGANIALACDIVVAKKSATFIQAFAAIGLIPDSGGTFFLPRLVGAQKAMALMMSGDKVSADEAEAMNMIYKSIADDEFDQFVTKMAAKMAKMPTRGYGLTKKAINASFNNSLKEQLDLEEKLQAIAGSTSDFKEGTQAFLEKRKPNFTGK
ncbi:2-(1,2-epoxy-1,2-dihydrophenyl)acetyl-CoA isomerase [Brumimicrobium salinarum]|uniref:2-(1,2-epoxy-1,2-dihydrophenyl)acetyl-CoA isomerase n=1 Tax=Brumimicrobium salinarum TaxID=2058658 RepID=A0A2I0R146_9FLAO|nr:enoyl-CoA hydratase-related protein [Brumimicrobium salinarum]PKR80120.1 2-(1,2-epoxy-1,2-dihydrophenyl)acetyl-CoA isomerase [Brumimicrobium salinarum]